MSTQSVWPNSFTRLGKKQKAFSRIHQLMRELQEALDYVCSHLFLKVPFLFTVLSAIPKGCNSVGVFIRDQLALWVIPPFPVPSSQHLSACICFHNNTISYYFCKFKIPSHFVYCLFFFLCMPESPLYKLFLVGLVLLWNIAGGGP